MYFPGNLSIGIPAASFVSYCALLILALGSRRSKIAGVFIYYLVFMMIWSLGSLMMRTGTFPGTLGWNRIMVSGMIMVPFVFFNFTQEIIERADLAIVVKIGYFLGGFFFVSNLFGLIVKNAYMINGNLTYTLGPLAQIFGLIGGGYIFVSGVMLFRRRMIDPESFSNKRLIYPSIGSILMALASLFDFVPQLGQYPLDIAANTINAFLLTYAIYRYRLLNITITIRKGLLYSILTIILTTTYLLTVFFLQQALKTKAEYIAFAVVLPLAAIISFTFEPFKALIRTWIDKLFFGQQYKYRTTLTEFSHLMTSILDLEQLTHSTLELVRKALQVESAIIFLPDSESNFYAHASVGIDTSLASAVRLDKTSPILCWLSQQSETALSMGEIETLPEFSGLWQREKEELHELKASLLIGIKMYKDLKGILLLSQKTSGDPYTDDDMELLLTLANESAIAISNSRIYMEAKSQAIKDDLTNLYNYRFLHEFLDKEIARCNRTGQVISVIFMDLDHFKTYNDVYGHLAGDVALTKVGEVISQCIRATDVAARCGGDEFIITLPAADANSVMAVAQRIQNGLQKLFPASSSSSGGLLTVSMGIAFYPEHAQNKQGLLSCADRALYWAKKSGKNSICIYEAGHRETGSLTQGVETELGFLRQQVEDAYLALIYTLGATINARDNYTYIHSQMVTWYAVTLAESLKLSEEQKEIIRHAGMLHDIGKIGIPESILNKPDPLNETEQEIVRQHVSIGEAIVSQTPFLRRVAPIILHHHEAYDGSGYPLGLKGENIPLESRILAIADAYHAMTSDRPYRVALTQIEAINQLQLLAGKQFDGSLVAVFVNRLRGLDYREHPLHPDSAHRLATSAHRLTL